MAVIGILTFQHYGISWDEYYSRRVGLVNFNYIFKVDKQLLEFHDRDYGAIFEILLIGLEKLLRINDLRELYLMRHLVTHFLFLFSAIYFYRIGLQIFSNYRIAIMSLIIYLFNPVIYGHSFYNSKDIVFMSMLVISLFYLLKAEVSKRNIDLLKFGVAFGLVISIRVIGLIFFPTFLVFLFLKPSLFKELKPTLTGLGLLIFSITATVLISWPYLWENTMSNFSTAIINMSKFVRYKGEVLVLGIQRKSINIGWDYFFIYFFLTTPLAYLILGLGYIFLSVYGFIKNPKLYYFSASGRIKIVLIIYFISPILAVIVFKSVLYDSWRHLFFIYPGFVLLAGYMLELIEKKVRLNYMIITFSLIISYEVFLAVKTFPNHHIYFNQLVSTKPEYIRKNFEQDYWGTSFNQALDYLYDYAKEDTIKVHFKPKNGLFNLSLLPNEKKQKFQCVSTFDSADYFVTNYRYHPDDYIEFKNKSIYSISLRNSKILEIFKIKP